MNAAEFLSFLNREISKVALGQSFTTEPGANGNFATAEIAKRGSLEIARYDGRALCDTLERDLVEPLVRLNFPGAPRHLFPTLQLITDEAPDPKDVIDIATKATAIDIVVDADKVAYQAGIPTLPSDDSAPRRTRMLAAGKEPAPPDDGATTDNAGTMPDA